MLTDEFRASMIERLSRVYKENRRLCAENGQLRQQRDALLDALEKLVEAIGYVFHWNSDKAELVERRLYEARAAIAAARGEEVQDVHIDQANGWRLSH